MEIKTDMHGILKVRKVLYIILLVILFLGSSFPTRIQISPRRA